MARSGKKKKRRIIPKQKVEDYTHKEEVSALVEDSSKPKVREVFSGWPMIIGWAAMIIFTFHACTRMVAAGDTWVAMACGRHFVNHGVDTVEPFSANSHKAGPTEEEVSTWPGWAQWITDKVGLETVKKWHPTGWINQNWLTHIIFYKLVPKSSYADGVSFTSNALVYWKIAIYLITMICVFYTCRLVGVNPALAAVFSCFALFIGRSFLDIRPAGFSNMLVAVFILILVLATYRSYLFIWLLVPVVIFWCNVHGGYIYAFIMLIPFIGLQLMTNLNKKWTAILYNIAALLFMIVLFAKAGLTLATLLFFILLIVLDIILIFYKNALVPVGWKRFYHTVAASIVTFLGVVIFNPFHLTNLTHTFVISVSEYAAQWRQIHEWKPAFEWDNPVGTAVPFLVMFIIAWLMLAIWTVVSIWAFKYGDSKTRRRRKNSPDVYQRPNINLSLLIIAALTTYMAIRSRRFIPIAGITACPVIAMFIDQVVRAIAAAINFRKNNRFIVSQMPDNIQKGIIALGVVAVMFFGIWWGGRIKYVYLDPLPADAKYDSVFMRMTASGAKPFYAMKFIKDNKLSGKMFNHWTEGGFIAWGQEPDPETGKTPLQLFMDGRAQAAYDHNAFNQWMDIQSGGGVIDEESPAYRIMGIRRRQRRELNDEDYEIVWKWMDEQLEQQDVWLFLSPASVFRKEPNAKPEQIPNSYYTHNSMERNPNWRMVFFNSKQKIFVDIRTERGKALYEGIFTGQTVYPDEYHKNLILGHYYLQSEEKEIGLEYAIEAFNLDQSSIPLYEILANASPYSELRPQVTELCDDYIREFMENKDDWSKQSGYSDKLEAARLAYFHLQQIALASNNNRLSDSYEVLGEQCSTEAGKINEGRNW